MKLKSVSVIPFSLLLQRATNSFNVHFLVQATNSNSKPARRQIQMFPIEKSSRFSSLSSSSSSSSKSMDTDHSAPFFLHHPRRTNTNTNSCYVDSDDKVEWVQVGKRIVGEAAGDNSGYSVDLSGDGSILAIGAQGNDAGGTDAGNVRVYHCKTAASGLMSSCKKWIQLGQTIEGKGENEFIGFVVSLSRSGLVVATGGYLGDGGVEDSGLVRVYQLVEEQLPNGKVDMSWKQLGSDIKGENANDLFGGPLSLSADGLKVAIGAELAEIVQVDENTNTNTMRDAGKVQVFQYQKGRGSWMQVGLDIKGKAANDYFGWSVSLSGDALVVAIAARAYVQVFENVLKENQNQTQNLDESQFEWVQLGSTLKTFDDYSRKSVSISGDGTTLAASRFQSSVEGMFEVQVFRLKPNADSDSSIGNVNANTNTDVDWKQIGAGIEGDSKYRSVTLSANGNILAVGDKDKDKISDYAGQVSVFQFKDELNEWEPLGQPLHSIDTKIDGAFEDGGNRDAEEAKYNSFGNSVALSQDGYTVAAGAHLSSYNGDDSGHTRVFNIPCGQTSAIATPRYLSVGSIGLICLSIVVINM